MLAYYCLAVGVNIGFVVLAVGFPVFWSLVGDICYLVSILCRRKVLRRKVDTTPDKGDGVDKDEVNITTVAQWNDGTLKQRFIAGVLLSLVPTCTILNVYCCVFWRYTLWWYLPYAVYRLFIDDVHSKGGYRMPSLCNFALFRSLAQYFSFDVQLMDSNPNGWPKQRPYIFATHPHGVFAISLFLNFATPTTGFEDSLPIPLEIHPTTLNMNLRLPFLGTFQSRVGTVSCEIKSLQRVLNKNKHAVAISLGGAREAQFTGTGIYHAVARMRRGVFLLALRNGACLVPVYTFGDDDAYLAVRLPLPMRFISDLLRRTLGFSLPVFFGRGIFQNQFGFVPFQRKFLTVVGKPMLCPRIENPTEEDLNDLREKYITEVTHIFNTHKKTALGDANVALQVE